jgi:hypothetical protein
MAQQLSSGSYGLLMNDYNPTSYYTQQAINNAKSQISGAVNNAYASAQIPGMLGASTTGTYGTNGGVATGGYATGGGYAAPARPAYDQATVDQFDSGIRSLESGINRLPGQLSVALGNINDQFTQSTGRLDTAKTGAETQYKTGSTGNMQSLRTNKNNINDQASGGLRGLLRTLGMYGAVGSDRSLAGNAVSDQATQQRSGAGSTFSQNQRGLDTNWGQFKNEDETRRKELFDWKVQQERSADAQSDSTKQDLLTRLAELRGQRAATIGGSYKGAAQPYLDQANGLSGRIDELARFKPTFDGATPQYTAPTLSSYNMGQAPRMSIGQTAGAGTPAINAILGINPQDDEKNKVTF